MPNILATTEYRFSNTVPEQVYDAWLDPEVVHAWMTRNLAAQAGAATVTSIEIDPVVGGRYRFAGLQNGQPSDAWGSYRVLDRGHRLVFTWFIDLDEEREDNSTVTLDLRPDGSDTRAILSHEMDDRWAEYGPQTAKAWQGMLKAIDETLRKVDER